MAETDNADNLEIFAIEEHRFSIDANRELLAQMIDVAREIIAIQNAHAGGARVSAIVVEMERPT